MANMSFANNAATTLASSITNVATSLTVQTGAGALFPTLTGSQYFYCTLENGSGTSREIIKVTARSTDTFTIVRGQDGTTGTAFSINDKVELRLVRANLQDFAILDESNTFSQQQTVSSGIKFGDGTTQTTAPIASSYSGVYRQIFTSTGSFTVPTGVTAVKVTAIGGGGGGGGTTGGTGGTTSFGTYVSAAGGAGTASSGLRGTGGACTFSGVASSFAWPASYGNGIAGTGGCVPTAGPGGTPGFLPGGPFPTYGNGGAGDVGNGGGGAGGYGNATITGLTSGSSITVTVGAGGTGTGGGSTAVSGLLIVEW